MSATGLIDLAEKEETEAGCLRTGHRQAVLIDNSPSAHTHRHIYMHAPMISIIDYRFTSIIFLGITQERLMIVKSTEK